MRAGSRAGRRSTSSQPKWPPIPISRPSGWIGGYEITQKRRVNGGWIFDEANGNLFDHAGFAHLPSGPTDDLGDGS